MSDIYELGDSIWNEFGGNDDHIVPHSIDEYGDQYMFQVDNRKKPRHQLNSVTSNVNRFGIPKEGKRGFQSLSKDKMLEKGSWSQSTDGVFPDSCDNDSLKEVRSIASDDSRMSTHGFRSGNIDSVGSEFCTDDPLMVDKCDVEENNVYSYPLNHISQPEDDLSFFDNDREDKESDLLCCGWPDIGNFEEVDRMFRSCDSTFGLGSLSNEDDLCWFSSEDALKPETKLNNGSEHHDESRPESVVPSNSDSNRNRMFINDKISSQNVGDDDLSNMSSDMKSKEELIPNEQVKRLSPSGERNKQLLQNGGSRNVYGNSIQPENVKNPYKDVSGQVFSPSSLQQQKKNKGPESLSYKQTNMPYMHMSYSDSSDQISACTKSENNGNLCSTKESSYASNQVQSMESPLDSSYEGAALILDENTGHLHHQQGMQISFNRSLKNANQMTLCNPATVTKQAHQSEQDEGHSEVEGLNIRLPAELDSLNAHESSCVSSLLDDISLEASSFRQLQNVMEKLDIRTKLCIRDSLYRLARSAEQRHTNANTNNCLRDKKDANGPLVAEEPSKCAGFMDIETDTNPIDRSIAHLLFHRPSDPSVITASDTLSFKPQSLIHGSITGEPITAGKHASREETAGGLENRLLTNDGK